MTRTRWLLGSILAAMIIGPAFAADPKPPIWNDFTALTADKLPISIQLAGWQDASWVARARARDGLDADKQGKVFYYEGVIRKGTYYGYVSALETSHDRIWMDDPLKDIVARRSFFENSQLTFEPQSSIDIWPAKFRYILFTAQKNGATAYCLNYLSGWRSYMVEGFLCDDRAPITDAAAQTFLKSLGYKNELSPVTGTLN